jgi:hypothetical protein
MIYVIPTPLYIRQPKSKITNSNLYFELDLYSRENK